MKTVRSIVPGSDHGFTVDVDDELVANAWHSDKGEWTVYFVRDESYEIVRSRDEALAVVDARLLKA